MPVWERLDWRKAFARETRTLPGTTDEQGYLLTNDLIDNRNSNGACASETGSSVCCGPALDPDPAYPRW